MAEECYKSLLSPSDLKKHVDYNSDLYKNGKNSIAGWCEIMTKRQNIETA
jgi:hypothetical protein